MNVASADEYLADRWERVVAVLIDAAVAFVIVGIPTLVVTLLSSDRTASRFVTYGIGSILLLVQLYLIWRDGQSIGKKMVGIQIVQHDEIDELERFTRNVLVRTVVPGLLFLIPMVGGWLVVLDLLFILRNDRRCLHDLLANTKVMKM